ncbi:MAG: hypothetical protein FWH41_01095 [Treponema sp.]|nr:hypothetical protein [Treponema sp.]
MKYLDFQKGGFINDFSKIFIGKFPQWVDFNINSFAVSPPNKEVFDKNILADLRARNSDPELIVYVDSFVNQIEMIEAEAISIRSKAGAEEIEKERKGLDVYAKKIEIETAAKIKIMHELSNIVANLKNIKGVFAPDYPNVRTIINGGENKNEIDILLSLFTGLLAKHLDSELGTELKQITNKIINKKKE